MATRPKSVGETTEPVARRLWIRSRRDVAMLNGAKVVFAALVSLVLAGCASQIDRRAMDSYFLLTNDMEAVREMQPHGPAFVQGLRAGYVEIMDYERAQMDSGDVRHFGRKAVAAASGVNVLPDEVALREIDAAAAEELSAARARLMDAFDRDARRLAPLAAARAQTAFDCWLEGSEFDPPRAEDCKDRFTTAMAAVEDALASGIENVYVVFFAWDKAEITPVARKIIAQVAADYEAGEAARLVVAGHADRSGPAAYNFELSERRARAVAEVLAEMGVPETAMELVWYGETRPRVPTPDGVREPQNRRVEISLE